MLFRTIANLSRCSQTSQFFRSLHSINHPFFNPSYKSPDDLIIIDDITNDDNYRRNTNNNYNPAIAPVLSITRGYLIYDSTSLKNHDEEESNHFLLLQKQLSSSKVGNVNLTSLSNRSHLHDDVKLINLNRFKRSYSTQSKTNNNTIKEVEKNLKSFNAFEKPEIQDIKIKIVKEDQQQHTPSPILDTSIPEIPNDPIAVQELIIDGLLNSKKYNEILPIYSRIKNNNLNPSLSIYNKVISSIPMRNITDESIEDNLSLLLTVYSDMLSNNIKPSNETYQMVLDSLFKGSLKSYQDGNFSQGLDFFKIGLELFLISFEKNSFNDDIYLNFINCLINYQWKSMEPKQLYQLINKVEDKLNFYLSLIQYTKFTKDTEYIQHLYTELQKLDSNSLFRNQVEIYSTMISSLNYCQEYEKSALFLNSILDSTQLDQNSISKLISSYIESQALINPYDAYESFIKFNKLKYLPDVSVLSLLTIFKSMLNLNDLSSACKVWNLMVIRKDFDDSIQNDLRSSSNYNYLSTYLDHYCDLLLNTQNKSSIVKFSNELLVKESLNLSNVQLIKLINYQTSNDLTDLQKDLIINQGLKKHQDDLSLNNYLSMIIDHINPSSYSSIFNTVFFKKLIEDYRLCNDNIYGLIKIFKELQHTTTTTTKSVLKNWYYYTRVLLYEFNDLSNYYIELPRELIEFKKDLEITFNQIKAVI